MQRRQPVFRLFTVIGLIAMAHLAATQLAHAQTWLAPANPDVRFLGPTRAAGAVIWSHGISIGAEDSQAPTPPFMARLRESGWDTYRLNRLRANDRFAASTRALVREVHRLKQQGYSRVALAGQSFGGFLSLMAARDSDEVDAVVATAPAAFGTYGDQYDTWRDNATKLYPLLAQVRRARVMLFYFHGDEFDPGGRGERSRDILAENNIDYIVIDQPRHLTTHWAAATKLFARLYGNCIVAFLGASKFMPDAQCRNGTYWAGAPESGQFSSVSLGASSPATPR